MSYQTITYELADDLATITLDRPDALNALDDRMAAELPKALKEASRAARALLVTGSGRAFCSGQDLKAVSGDKAPPTLGGHLESTWNRIVGAVHELEMPTVCAVNGIAAGAGASLAMACDIRIASEHGAFLEAFANVGLIVDGGGTWFLPRLVGLSRALEMAYTARKVGAEEAERIGLVNRVVPADDLMTEARSLGAKLASGPTAAFGWTKRAMVASYGHTLAEHLGYEARLQTAAGRSDDYAEGLAAFLEKRAPSFGGR